MRWVAALATLVLLTGACESTPTGTPVVSAPSNAPAFLKVPDTRFTLSPEQRATVHPVFNADVVEQLLSWIRPQYHAVALELFSRTRIDALGQNVAIGEVSLDTDHPQINELMKNVRASTRLPDTTRAQHAP